MCTISAPLNTAFTGNRFPVRASRAQPCTIVPGNGTRRRSVVGRYRQGMATSAQIILDGVERIREITGSVVDGLSNLQLEARLDPDANTISWLVWHLARVQDAQVADVAGSEQVWTTGWVERFGLPFSPRATGYGHSPEDVGAVTGLSSDLLFGYLDAVSDRTAAYVGSLSDGDLDRIVDERWQPPVTLSARLVSILSDDLQHAGQAAFIRGILERRSS